MRQWFLLIWNFFHFLLYFLTINLFTVALRKQINTKLLERILYSWCQEGGATMCMAMCISLKYETWNFLWQPCITMTFPIVHMHFTWLWQWEWVKFFLIYKANSTCNHCSPRKFSNCECSQNLPPLPIWARDFSFLTICELVDEALLLHAGSAGSAPLAWRRI